MIIAITATAIIAWVVGYLMGNNYAATERRNLLKEALEREATHAAFMVEMTAKMQWIKECHDSGKCGINVDTNIDNRKN